MKKKPIIFFFFLILLIPSIFAFQYFSENGFLKGLSWWGTQLSYAENSQGITIPHQSPLVEDLDNNGINEIIVMDGNVIEVYQNASLDLLDTIALNGSGVYFSNILIVYNWTYSTYLTPPNKAILTISERPNNAYMSLIWLNASGLQQTGWNVSSKSLFNYTNGEIAIGCRNISTDVDNCIMVYSKINTSLGTGSIYAKPFNETDFGDEKIINDDNWTYCFPRYRDIVVADYDQDGTEEFIFNYVRGSTDVGDPDEEVSIVYLNINQSSLSAGQDENCSGAIASSWYCEDAEAGDPAGYASNVFQYAITGFNDTYAFNSSANENAYSMPVPMDMKNYTFEFTARWDGTGDKFFGFEEGVTTKNCPLLRPALNHDVCGGTKWCYHTSAGYIEGVGVADTNIHLWKINSSGNIISVFIDGAFDMKFDSGVNCDQKGEWNLWQNGIYDNMGGCEGAFTDHCINISSIPPRAGASVYELVTEHHVNTTHAGNPVRRTGSPINAISCSTQFNDTGGTGTTYEHGNIGDTATNLLVFDIDNNVGNGLETVLGIRITDFDNEPEYKIYSYRGATLVDDYHPFLDELDGYMGNIFRVNSTSLGQLFCVSAYGWDGLEYKIGCGTEWGGHDWWQWNDRSSRSYNVSRDYRSYAGLTHQGRYVVTNDLLIYNAYGTFTLFDGVTDYNDRVFNMEVIVNNSAVVPIDYNGLGYDDMLLLSPTSLRYIDDGFINYQAEVINWSLQPCIYEDGEAVYWKNGTNLTIQIQVDDCPVWSLTKDNVSARATLYNGTVNEQNTSWTNNLTAQTWFNFTTLNITVLTNGSTIVFYGRDTENKTIVLLNETFRVATSGKEHDDCITYYGYYKAEVDAPPTPPVNNTVVDYMDDVSGWTGLPYTILWLLIMAFVTGVIWVQGSPKNPTLSTGVIIVFNIAMIVMGAYFEFFGWGFITFIIFIALVVGGIFFKKRIMNED